MKRYFYLLLLVFPLGICAQNMYNYVPFFGNDLTGTARFVGMGGSMSALGGDISVMATNPAGIGLYRSNDFSFTGSMVIKNNTATYGIDVIDSKSTTFNVENGGMVLSIERDNPVLKFLNIGVSYRYNNNLAGEFDMCGLSDGFSQQYTMDYIYKGNPFNVSDLNYRMYEKFGYSWLALLGAEAQLGDDAGNLFTFPDGELVWNPTDFGYYSEERGGVSSADFNVAMNLSDRVYLGATLGFKTVDYSLYSYYFEADNNGEIYSIENNYAVEGNGFDIKLGAIIRPFKYSPFRIGLSVHTPTWYDLKNYSSASIADPYGNVIDTRDYELYNDELRTVAEIATPWRFNASIAYTFGTYLALNAEYEYADYSTAEFTRNFGISKSQNYEIKNNMQAQHIYRVGAELNVEGMQVRVGYNNMTAPFKNTAYKDMDNAAVTETSTEYMNRYDKEIITLGFGYRGSSMYFDLAYMFQRQKSDFYPYYDYEIVNPCATVEHRDHSVMATVGMRF